MLEGVRRGGTGGRGDFVGDDGLDPPKSYELEAAKLFGLGLPKEPRLFVPIVGEAMFRDMLRGLRVRGSGGGAAEVGTAEGGGWDGVRGGGWIIVTVVVEDDDNCDPPLLLPDGAVGAADIPNIPVIAEFGADAVGLGFNAELNMPG